MASVLIMSAIASPSQGELRFQIAELVASVVDGSPSSRALSIHGKPNLFPFGTKDLALDPCLTARTCMLPNFCRPGSATCITGVPESKSG